MFTIFCDGVCIYDTMSPDKRFRVIDPKLKLADNSSGTLTFKVAKHNIGYENFQRMSSEIIVKRDGKEIWSGRIISEESDFYGNRKFTCEGELGYLNDTSQPPAEYHDMTVRGFLETLINIHNSKVTSDKRFTVGYVADGLDTNDSLYRYTNFESTLECINEKLIKRLGGHIRVRKENGVRYLDYLKDYINQSTQRIEFGQNLLDFTKSWELDDLATVVVPLGKQLEESPIEALEAYLTVEEVNDNSIYVKADDEVIESFGWIETVVHWDDVGEASNLLSKAEDYLKDAQFEKMVLTITAIDMSDILSGFKKIPILDSSKQNVRDNRSAPIYGRVRQTIESIKLLDTIRCISRPHGMDRDFPITEIEIQMDHPENTQFTLGANEKKTSLSASLKKESAEIKEQMERIPSSTSVLNAAKANAHQLLNLAMNGYITTVIGENGSEKLIISNDRDYTRASKYWVWSLAGLAHYDMSRPGDNPEDKLAVAITMDGSIVADRITTGTLTADIVKTGILQSNNGGSYWDLDTGIFYFDANAEFDDGTTVGGLRTQIAATAEGLTTEVSRRESQYDSLSSSISQTAEAINLKVSKGDVSSQLSMESGQITIGTGRLSIDSDNFKLTTDGIMTCKDANLKGSLTTIYYDSIGDPYCWVEYTSHMINARRNDGESCSIHFTSGVGSYSSDFGMGIMGDYLDIDTDKIRVKGQKGATKSLSFATNNGSVISITVVNGIITGLAEDYGEIPIYEG